MDVPVLTQRRRLAVNCLRKFLYFNGVRQTLTAADDDLCRTARSLVLGRPRLDVLLTMSRSLSVNDTLERAGVGAGAAAVDPPERGSTVTIW